MSRRTSTCSRATSSWCRSRGARQPWHLCARPKRPDLDRGVEIARRRWPVGLAALLVPLSAVGEPGGLPSPRVPGVDRRARRPAAGAGGVRPVDRDQRAGDAPPDDQPGGPQARPARGADQSASISTRSFGPRSRWRRRRSGCGETSGSSSVTDPVVRGGSIVAFTVSYTGRDPEHGRRGGEHAGVLLPDREQPGARGGGLRDRRIPAQAARGREEAARGPGGSGQRLQAPHIGENPKNMDANLAVLERLTAQLRLNSDNQNRALERREALARQFAGSEGMAAAGGGRERDGAGGDPCDREARAAPPGAGRAADAASATSTLTWSRLKAEIAVLGGADAERARRWARRRSATRGRSRTHSPSSFGRSSPRPRRRSPRCDRRSGGSARISPHTSAAWRTRRCGSRSSRSCPATTRRRASSTGRCSSATRRLSSPRPWSSGRRASSSGFSRRRSRRPRPSAPNRSSLLLLGGVLSLALGTGVALLVEWLDGSLHEVGDLRSLANVPVVARIPRLVSEGDMARHRFRLMAWAGAVVVMVTLTTAAAYATAKGHVPVASAMAHSLLLRS